MVIGDRIRGRIAGLEPAGKFSDNLEPVRLREAPQFLALGAAAEEKRASPAHFTINVSHLQGEESS